ncbi:hypothetical protein DERF_006612 [Dermatophagoides farinae]|uniref:Uncharacterized protein n=1 Tax=Dermatophagoides farinae TaxID=6954 RepID=A0A922HZD4_DERFA|nr:hypothetical protein DERF_006612 [Dermatophagoides farinae]
MNVQIHNEFVHWLLTNGQHLDSMSLSIQFINVSCLAKSSAKEKKIVPDLNKKKQDKRNSYQIDSNQKKLFTFHSISNYNEMFVRCKLYQIIII